MTTNVEWLSDAANAVRIRNTRPGAQDSHGFDFDWVVDAGEAVGGAIGDAAAAVGDVATSVGDAVADAATSAADWVVAVPILGDLVTIAWTGITSPIEMMVAIAKGERVDRAVLAHFERELANAKLAAPYVQIVIQIIPGVGQFASGAIAAGLVLASGQPIEKALLAGLKNALPGGPIAAAAFDIGTGVLQGKPVEEIGIDIVPLPEETKVLLRLAAQTTRHAVNGEPLTADLTKAALLAMPYAEQAAGEIAAKVGAAEFADKVTKAAVDAVPEDVREAFAKAYQIGTSVGQAQFLQGKVYDEFIKPVVQNELIQRGITAIAKSAALKAAAALLGPDAQRGYQIGCALISGKVGIYELKTMRDILSPVDRVGYDTAVSWTIGNYEPRTKGEAVLEHMGALRKYGTQGMANAVAAGGKLPPRQNVGTMAKPIIKAGKPTFTVPNALLLSSPIGQAASLVTAGMINATPDQKENMMRQIAADKEARDAAALTIKQVAYQRELFAFEHRSLWTKFLEFLGFLQKHVPTAPPLALPESERTPYLANVTPDETAPSDGTPQASAMAQSFADLRAGMAHSTETLVYATSDKAPVAKNRKPIFTSQTSASAQPETAPTTVARAVMADASPAPAPTPLATPAVRAPITKAARPTFAQAASKPPSHNIGRP